MSYSSTTIKVSKETVYYRKIHKIKPKHKKNEKELSKEHRGKDQEQYVNGGETRRMVNEEKDDELNLIFTTKNNN